MALLRFLLWTSACIALGIFLGTFEFGGKTPWQRARAEWKLASPRLDEVKTHAAGLADEARKRVLAEERPVEHHSSRDRAAVDELIAKRAK